MPLQDKKITIVHGGDKLLNDTYPDSFRRGMESKLRARKVDIILGEYVDQFPPSGSGELVFRSGEKLNAGLVVSNSCMYAYVWAVILTVVSSRPRHLVLPRTPQ